MKTNRFAGLRPLCFLVALGISFTVEPVFAQTFHVNAGDTINYTIDGTNDPPLTLERGVTYIFQINNLTIHPFWIKSALGPGSNTSYNTGVTNNGAINGNIFFGVTTNTPNSLFYQCGNHSGMNGTLTIVTPPSPPTVTVVYISVADLITLKSTGTNGNGWSTTPEYNCDLSGTNWLVVPSFTNSFVSGTNTTTFDRLDPLCGSTNVFIRVRNQKN
jgi:hypothetical protein